MSNLVQSFDGFEAFAVNQSRIVRCKCSRASTTRTLFVCNDRRRKKLYEQLKTEKCISTRQTKNLGTQQCYRLRKKWMKEEQNEIDSDVILFPHRTRGVTLAVRHASLLVKSGCVCSKKWRLRNLQGFVCGRPAERANECSAGGTDVEV